MKLTKEVEAEITQFLQTYWDTYFEGNLMRWQTFVAEDYKNIGTNAEEIWNNRNEILEYTRKVFDQMIGRADVRNKQVQIIPYDPYIMTHELGDLYVKTEDDWNYYAPIRLSSLLQKNGDGWVVLHQHGSFPDSKTQEGEAFAFDVLKSENKKLQKAVKKRTLELEKKNRELEVETALERIRAQAVAMKQSSDLLDIVVAMRNEFTKLGHQAHYFWHMMWLPDSYEKAMTSGDGSKIGFVMELPRHIHGDIPLLAQWEKSKKATVVYAMEVEEAIDYVDKMVALGDFKNIDPQAPTHDDIKHIGGLTFIMARTTHGEIGYSLPGVVKNPPKEDINILIKFAGAFDLAHQRFLDLQKAEQQARETQIELSLERIRSKSMAMHKSEELRAVVNTLYGEFQNLQADFNVAVIQILDDTQDLHLWVSTADGLYDTIIHWSYIDMRHFNEMYKAWTNQTPLSITLSKTETQAFFEEYFKIEAVPIERKEAVQSVEQMDIMGFYQKHTGIFLMRYTEGNYSKEEKDITQRFTKVFEQTYIRFLDLKKAEAQAREAQIEVAVERVRAEAMAMHTPDDFEKVTKQLLKQVQLLELEGFTGASILSIGENDVFTWWDFSSPGNISDPKSQLSTYNPHDYQILGTDLLDQLKKGENYMVFEYDLKRLNRAVREWEKINPAIATEFKKAITEGDFNYQWNPCGRLANGLLAFDMIKPPDEDVKNIVIKMTHAFEQAYIRFMDLQKAEAQAREAQIEMALEKVRSRTMAMHSSLDVGNTMVVLFEELESLGIKANRNGIIILDEEEHGEIWTAKPNKYKVVELMSWKLDMSLHGLTKHVYKAWKNKNSGTVYPLIGDDLKAYYKVLNKHTDIPVKFNLDTFPEQEWCYTFNFNEGFIYLFIDEKMLKEYEQIPERFASVFGQTYRRYQDLQKAEAQAREAQIETALEKVRSRTMAMQHSEELPEAANVLFREIQNLGIPAWSCGYNILSEDKIASTCFMSSEGEIQTPFTLPLTEHKSLQPWHHALVNNEPFFVYEQGGKDLQEHYDFMQNLPDLQDTFQQLKDAQIPLPTFQVNHLATFTNGFLLFITYERVPEAHDIFQRFAKVFEQTYTRFLDLQKAEAQAREAQIQLSLERVRAKTMAMQHSDELIETSELLFQQIKELGIDVWSCGYSLWYDDDSYFIGYNPMPDGKMGKTFKIPLTEDTFFKTIRNGKRDGKDFLVFESKGKSLAKTYDYMDKLPVVGEGMRTIVASGFELPQFQVTHCGYFSHGHLMFITLQHYPEAIDIFKRFTKEFEQTYTRFLDLQKAEAQAREAEIEAALERIRSRSMAMHKTDELSEVIVLLFSQLEFLNLVIDTCYIDIFDNDNQGFNIWVGTGTAIYPEQVHLPYFKHPIHQLNKKARQNNIAFFSFDEDEKSRDSYFEHFYAKAEGIDVPKKRQEHIAKGLGISGSAALGEHAGITMWNYRKIIYSREENDILTRVNKVFQQTYTRFLDLQKAEAQARNAQIEAALERVRAKAMAMHDSNELNEVLSVLCEQFDVLGIVPMSTHMTVFDFENNTFTFRETGKFGNRSFGEQTVALDAMDNWKETVDKWRADKATAINKLHFPKEQLAEVWEVFHESFASMPEASRITPDDYPDGIYHTAGKHPFGYIGMNQIRPATEEEEEIVIKFATEFGMAYQRFLDLKKAEAQAREALIEACLEKVRSRSLAMQHANELKDVVVVIVEKLTELGVILDANGVTLCTYFPDSKDVLHWIASPDFKHVGKYLLPYFDHIIFEDAWESKERGDAYFSKAYSVADKNSFFEHAFEHSDYKHFPEEIKAFIFNNDKHTLSFAWQKNSAILIPSNTGVLPTEDEKEILIRFSKVFEQAYIRFMDLQKAEKRARENQIEIALERVRSRTMGMQKSDELAETSSVLFQQIKELASETWSCGFCIWQDNDEVELWMGADSGGLLPPMSIPYKKEPTHREIYDAFLRKEPAYNKIWNGKALKEHYAFLRTIPSVAKALKVMEDSGLVLPTQQCYYVGFFKHGYLLLITKEPSDQLIELSKRFAQAFDLTYTRFLDLQLKEKQSVALVAEKQRLEKTLSDLQTTQKQLIQSEKMASLGELTAGIAHEIQNPLNFVNNFSEVSKELLDEMQEELENGDMEEVKALMDDIIQNLEKINHHGKRADGIVKGMLQHSRAGGDKKEPTDINKLTDEYMRLAYHGLRAKDKSFNATLKTDYDENIGNINIIPQDMGRVILNLFTNAFYACAERSRSTANEKKSAFAKAQEHPIAYMPAVIVSTKRLSSRGEDNGEISISVKDNGNGIPQSVIDKIFQPFFTTKPTGQGTGLGLSMSYDIITKGHGGTLEVDTEEGKGTTFTIKLKTN